MTLDNKQQEFVQLLLAKLFWEWSAFDIGSISRGIVNHSKTKAAIEIMIKHYPATDEMYWIEFLKQLKKEQPK